MLQVPGALNIWSAMSTLDNCGNLSQCWVWVRSDESFLFFCHSPHSRSELGLPYLFFSIAFMTTLLALLSVLKIFGSVIHLKKRSCITLVVLITTGSKNFYIMVKKKILVTLILKTALRVIGNINLKNASENCDNFLDSLTNEQKHHCNH